MKLTPDMLPPADPQAGLNGLRGLDRTRAGAEGLSEAEREKRADAARQFEGLLLTQLMKVMRKSAPMLEGGQGKLYMQMFDSAIAEQLSKAGGVGLAPIIEQSMSGGREASAAVAAHGASQGYGVGMPRVGEPVSLAGQAGDGHMAKLQTVASDLILHSASRWSKAGSLTPSELASDFNVDGAHFNVQDAQGYEGHPKCNLFAFEVARRAGFQVPVVARSAGWGFPSADAVTEDAAQGRLPSGWGRVVTGVDSGALSAAADSGKSAFMLAGSGQEGRAGHMAIVERIHEIEYDDYGRVKRAVFDGWEARTGGAQHLTRRTWNRSGTHGGHLARSGFGRIEIIELSPASTASGPEVPLSPTAPPSFRDVSRSSDLKKHPIDSSEDAS